MVFGSARPGRRWSVVCRSGSEPERIAHAARRGRHAHRCDTGGRRAPRVLVLALVVAFTVAGSEGVASADDARAWLVADAANGEIVQSRNPQLASYPASLTKLMTAYLLFEALDAGMLTLDDRVTVSAAAAAQQPRKLGLRKGRQLRLEHALLAAVVYSANDAAVVVADAVAGSEAAFVARMNATAKGLGMLGTRFRNATGLPDFEQVTNAYDMFLLARAITRDFPNHYHYFSRRGFSFGRRYLPGHNNFVATYKGADGLKTGFTCHAGYNLVAAAERGGRRFVGVVLGAPDRDVRDRLMKRLFDRVFAGKTGTRALARTSDPSGRSGMTANRQFIARSCINPRGGRKRREPDPYQVRNFSVEFGVEVEREDALAGVAAFIEAAEGALDAGEALLIPRWVGTIIHRMAVTNLEQADATAYCKRLRDVEQFCLVLTPEAAGHALSDALRTLELVRKRHDDPRP